MATARLFCFYLLVSVLCSCSFRADPARSAAENIDQRKWSAAESDLRRAFIKDTLNVEAKFIYAQYFLSNGNPAFNPDSAQLYIQRALEGLSLTTPRQRERLHKVNIDSARLLEFRSQVDSAAFARAQKLNTTEGYSFFIEHYPLAISHSEAIELRDEAAYLDVLKKNTQAAFKQYVERYPESRRVKDAEERYLHLLSEAERSVFEAATSSGLIRDYLSYLEKYPKTSQSAKAKDILGFLVRDSLSINEDAHKSYWVPFLKNGLYGFMDDDGNEVMAPQFESIDSSYLCGEITQDFIVTSSGVYSRGGVLLLKKTPTKTKDLGNGFLSLIDGNCMTVVHQSGFQVGDNCVEDATIVADQFLALKKQKGWSIYAFNGKPLVTSFYDGITNVDKLIVLKRYGKNVVVKANQVAAVSPARPLDESLVFDDVRAWGEGNLWVKNGVLEGVINQSLEFVIPLDRQILVKTSFGFTRKKDARFQVIGISPDLENQSYDDVRDYGDWLELKTKNKSKLYRVSEQKVVGSNLDSVWTRNRVAFGAKGDSLNVYAGASRLASFERNAPVTFIRSDSIVYFWVPEKRSKVVFEASRGKKLFTSEFDEIEVTNRDFFIFSRKNKKGIFRRDGKVIVPAEYDAIIPTSNGYLSLLKDKKFGLYDTKNQKLIKSQYERNVLPYARNYFVAYKNGYGIIDSSGEPITGFDFEEIRYWNDSAAWVKKNFYWSILSIQDKELRMQKIRSFQTIKDQPDEKIVRVQQDNYYGIVSNKQGVIITPTFTEVINVGSEEKPFYFTEKHVEEADIYVVIYYNSRGKLVKKQVYEEDEYEKIYCDQ